MPATVQEAALAYGDYSRGRVGDRWGHWSRAVTAAVGIGGKPAVGKDALQTDIADRLAKAGEQPQSVTCKDDLVGEVGKTARCEVVISPTNSFEPVITVTGVDGSTINYEMSPPLSKEQLEKAVSRLVADAAHAHGRVGVV